MDDDDYQIIKGALSKTGALATGVEASALEEPNSKRSKKTRAKQLMLEDGHADDPDAVDGNSEEQLQKAAIDDKVKHERTIKADVEKMKSHLSDVEVIKEKLCNKESFQLMNGPDVRQSKMILYLELETQSVQRKVDSFETAFVKFRGLSAARMAPADYKAKLAKISDQLADTKDTHKVYCTKVLQDFINMSK